MKKTSVIQGKAGNYQIQSDGKTVWVNGPDGGNVARFNNSIDIHTPVAEQLAGKNPCLFCTTTENTKESWPLFVDKLKEYYEIEIPQSFQPEHMR